MMPYWGKLPGAHCTSPLELPAPFPRADLKNPLQQLNIMLNPGPVHGQSLQNQNLSRKYITTADSKNRVAWQVDQKEAVAACCCSRNSTRFPSHRSSPHPALARRSHQPNLFTSRLLGMCHDFVMETSDRANATRCWATLLSPVGEECALPVAGAVNGKKYRTWRSGSRRTATCRLTCFVYLP